MIKIFEGEKKKQVVKRMMVLKIVIKQVSVKVVVLDT